MPEKKPTNYTPYIIAGAALLIYLVYASRSSSQTASGSLSSVGLLSASDVQASNAAVLASDTEANNFSLQKSAQALSFLQSYEQGKDNYALGVQSLNAQTEDAKLQATEETSLATIQANAAQQVASLESQAQENVASQQAHSQQQATLWGSISSLLGLGAKLFTGGAFNFGSNAPNAAYPAAQSAYDVAGVLPSIPSFGIPTFNIPSNILPSYGGNLSGAPTYGSA